MRILIIGFGSIARKHIRCIQNTCPDVEIMLLRRKINADDAPPQVNQSTSLAECIGWSPTHVIICTPTSLHLEFLQDLIAAQIPILVEKPLSSPDRRHIKELQDLLILRPDIFVAYPYRFHDIFKQMKLFLSAHSSSYWNIERGYDLRKWQDYATSYTHSYAARNALGGGALATLCHELDMFISILGYPDTILGHTINSGLLGIESHDIAQYTLQWHDCITATFRINLLDHLNHMTISGLTTDGTIGCVSFTPHNQGEHIPTDLFASQSSGAIAVGYPFSSLNAAYQEQINAFLSLDFTRLCSLQDGINSMMVMLKINDFDFTRIQ